MSTSSLQPTGDEASLVAAARTGDQNAIRALIQANNRRLFRTARAVLRNDAEAEDVVQAAYVKAFTHLDGFRGEAAFATWLTRIALNEALSRRRQQRPAVDLAVLDAARLAGGAELIAFPGVVPANPETEAGRAEMKVLLEELIDGLPDDFRVVFVLREIEELSTVETAAELGIKPETVKTRLFRARRLLRTALEQRLTPAFSELFPFDGARCANLADRVVAALK